MRPGESITIKDVARRAGVSQATAARALGSYGRINAQTRERVLAAAHELGYHTNALARSMVTGTTHTLGLVLADIENPFFSRVARAVADVARRHGYTLLLANSDEDLAHEQEAVRALAEKRVDGLIVVPASSTDNAHLAVLVERGLPVVLMDRSVPGIEADTIMVDNVAAAYGAVRHLTELGHRRVGMITASDTIATTTARIAGYRQALAEAGGAALGPVGMGAVRGPDHSADGTSAHGRPADAASPRAESAGAASALAYPSHELTARSPDGPDGALVLAPPDEGARRWLAFAEYSQASAQAETAALLARPAAERPTAIFATDSILTAGAFRAIRAAGLTVPDDVSLIGFDDVDWMSMVRPAVTVVDQPVYELGRRAAERLMARIEGDQSPPHHLWLETELILRPSCAPPRPLE